MNSVNQDFLRGTLRTIVLRLLAQHGRMYGYEITQAVKTRTEGELVLTFGALYPVLHKLEQEGLLVTQTEEADGRLRKYYALTPAGTKTVDRKITEFERFAHLMRLLLKPSSSWSVGQ
ncbi:PadR family transcriptional regulator [Spirosoma sp.]|uniref:PadR family transcriptional regulator n=1 Tax=Spirosoma sp. TaxID=1899569 RepID=UPI003B3A477B